MLFEFSYTLPTSCFKSRNRAPRNPRTREWIISYDFYLNAPPNCRNIQRTRYISGTVNRRDLPVYYETKEHNFSSMQNSSFHRSNPIRGETSSRLSRVPRVSTIALYFSKEFLDPSLPPPCNPSSPPSAPQNTWHFMKHPVRIYI